MQLERLEFEFNTGIDPLTGEKRTIRSVDRDGKTKGEIALGVYHVKNADGEWKTLPKHQDLKALTREYGGDDYQDVY